MKCSLVVPIVHCALLTVLSAAAVAGQLAPGLQTNGQYNGGLNVGTENMFVYAAVEIEVKGPSGQPIPGPVYVSLLKVNGQVFMTTMAKGGKATFSNVPKSELTAEVVASGYETAKKSFEVLDKSEVKVKIDLQPMTDKEVAASDRGISALPPKAQKDIGRALEALRANKPVDARQHLEAAQRDAPNSAEVEYLFGVYASQMGDMKLAQSYWMRALELNPNHLSSLLGVSQALLHQREAAEASPYLQRAMEIEPSSWRAHMLMAEADLFQKKYPDAVKEAERATELGHERAASVQPLLAHALYETGEKDRALQLLQGYIKAHPQDANAANLLERLQKPATVAAAAPGAATGENSDVSSTADTSLPIASNWLPPDVDEKIPPVEPGATCSLPEVLDKAGAQLVAFVHDVDRFTATEQLTHESINKYGIAAAPEKRKFDYVVSIEEIRHGYLGVTEFRDGGGAQGEFPDGIVTNGLPALVLVFHPFYADNYEMTCEGLARMSSGLAWQVHFRQKPGKPNEIQSYQTGINGPSFPVALKGRAWISADNYQVVRMETDMVAPMPQIRLLAEHTDIEYGPVNFRRDNVNLWLPHSAEVYFAWRGKQMHRRHSFTNYLLFGVDENQRIATPKNAEAPADTAPPGAAVKPSAEDRN
ncbi:MAG: tetratricopeptide repeat protein [Candidatus Acidiferrum sp.]